METPDDRQRRKQPFPWFLNPLILLFVVLFGLLPCTSGPLVLGYFYGWPWAVGGIALCWGAAAFFHGLIEIPWKRKTIVEEKEKTDDVS